MAGFWVSGICRFLGGAAQRVYFSLGFTSWDFGTRGLRTYKVLDQRASKNRDLDASCTRNFGLPQSHTPNAVCDLSASLELPDAVAQCIGQRETPGLW